MTDLILKILIASVLYGGAMFTFGLALGKAMKSVTPPEEKQAEYVGAFKREEIA